MKAKLRMVEPANGSKNRIDDPVIEVDGVGKSWSGSGRSGSGFVALSSVSLAIPRGKFTVILGPSGCGKSTLLRMIAGLETPTEGTITALGEQVTGPGWRRGMMFQDYALFPWRTVLGNVMFGPLALGRSRAASEEKAKDLIRLVGLGGFEHSYPAQLSGGMQQRAALARALANDPDILLMDEPFSAVDSQTRESLQDELLRIWQVTQKSIVFVTHDISEAVYLADVIVVMAARPGRIKVNLDVALDRPRDRISLEFVRMARATREALSDSH